MKDVPGWEVSAVSNRQMIQCSRLLITWSSGVLPLGSRLRCVHDSLVKVSTTTQAIGLRRRSWLYDGSSFSLYHAVEQSESAAVDEPQLRNLWMDDERLVAAALSVVQASSATAWDSKARGDLRDSDLLLQPQGAYVRFRRDVRMGVWTRPQDGCGLRELGASRSRTPVGQCRAPKRTMGGLGGPGGGPAATLGRDFRIGSSCSAPPHTKSGKTLGQVRDVRHGESV